MDRPHNPIVSLALLLSLGATPAFAEQVFLGHTARVNSVAFSPDGSRVASASHDHTVRQWRLAAGPPLCSIQLDGIVWCVAYDPTGDFLGTASYDNYMRSLWNAETCAAVQPPFSGTSDISFCFAFSPDGTYLVGGDGSPESGEFLWAVASRAQIWHETHAGNVLSVAFSPDGTKIVSGSSNGTARLWDISGAQICSTPLQNGSVNSVAFSPDGLTFWTACDDGIAREWNLDCSRAAGELAGHVGAVLSVATSPNGAFIGTGGDDGTVRIWYRPNGTPAYMFEGHAGPVHSVAWSPSSTKIASAGEDHTVRVWPVRDCNNNDTPDEDDVIPSSFHDDSVQLSPIGNGFPQSHTVFSPPVSVSDVTLTFKLRADVSAPNETIDATLNSVSLGTIFAGTGTDCANPFAQSTTTLSAAAFNSAVAHGDALITMTGNANVNANLCNNPASWISVSVDYQAAPVSQDCNFNGIPDECEPKPACDVNCDGSVNPFDIQWFLELLFPEPPTACSPCAGDANGDGTVNPFDINAFLECLNP